MLYLLVYMCLYVHVVAMVDLPELEHLTPLCTIIHTSTGAKINAAVTIGSGVCDRLKKSYQVDGSQARADISLDVRVDGETDQPVVDISWTYTGKKVPKYFMLNMNFTHEMSTEPMNSTCILYKLDKSRRDASMIPVTFTLKCLPLFKEPKLYLLAQVWAGGRGSASSCQRQPRLLGDDVNPGCDVQCSERTHVAVSQDYYRSGLCSCHGNPELEWSYVPTTSKFNVSLTQLPPYLQTIEVSIVKVLTHFHNITESFWLFKVPANRSVELHSAREYGLGTYFINLHAKCPSEKKWFKHECETELNINYISKTIEVTATMTKSGTPDALSAKNHHHPFPTMLVTGIVLGVLFVAVLLTCVGFIVNRQRRKRRSKGQMSRTDNSSDKLSRNGASQEGIEMQQNPAAQGLLTDHQSENETSLQQPIKNADDPVAIPKEDDVQDGDSAETKPAVDGVGVDLKPRVDLLPLLIRERISKVQKVSNDNGQCHQDGVSVGYRQQCGNNTHNRVTMVTQVPRVPISHTKEVLYLYQGDNNDGVYNSKVVALEHRLRSRDINVVSCQNVGLTNCQDFAETVFDRFPEIVIVVSEKLNSLCYHHEQNIPHSSQLPMNSQLESIQLIILDKLRTPEQPRDPQYSAPQYPCNIRVVSLKWCQRVGQQLLEQFLENYGHIARSPRVYLYNMHGETIDSPVCTSELNKLFNQNFMNQNGV